MCGECNTTLQLYFLTVLIYVFLSILFSKREHPSISYCHVYVLRARVTFGMASLWALSVFWEEATPEVRVLRK